MNKVHHYKVCINWTGNNGTGTSSYKSYERSHSISVDQKAIIEASSDPNFRGDVTKHNPEELFLAAISSCHMLWYLHLCAEAGIIVTHYSDDAKAIMQETADGGGHFIEATLHPHITITDLQMLDVANLLHKKANQLCFIANSCNFPIKHDPLFKVEKIEN